jgi:purine-cytosine permease-like protein
MWVTIPLYLGFMTWAIVKAAETDVHASFWSFHPAHPPDSAGGPGLLQLLAAVIAIISNAALAADIGRFVPLGQRRVAAFAMGYVFEAVTLLGVTMLGAWFAVRLGTTDPGAYITYSGSLAYANFFARLFHLTPGRHWWVVLTALAGTALMLGGVYDHLSQVLTFEGVFVIAWMMAVTSDMLINKRWLKLSPPDYPFKRAHTYQFNPVGVGALAAALIVAEPLAFGVAGQLGKNLAPFVSLVLAFVAAPVIAALTHGRYYRAPTTAVELDPTGTADGLETCVRCGERFELMELVQCPFLTAPLCSMCCGGERNCGELCKQEGAEASPAAGTGGDGV